MLNKKGLFAVIIVLALAAFVVIQTINRNSSKSTGNQPQVTQSPSTPSPTPVASSSSTVSSVPENKPTSVSTSSIPGGTRAQITCNYQIPAAPNQYGTASIESNWNNLVLGKNTSAKLSVCVSANGTSSRIAFDTRVNGSRIDSVPWISLNTDYIFTLYDNHGGDLSDCEGAVLSSCEINTNLH